MQDTRSIPSHEFFLATESMQAIESRPATEIRRDYKFISEPSDDLKCLICLELAVDPWQHDKCGKLLCGQCIERHERSKSCPCRESKPNYFKDSRSRRDIQALHVRCDHCEESCGWEGTVDQLKTHLSTCIFRIIFCPKSFQVSNIMWKDLETHLAHDCPMRDFECMHCGLEGTYKHITRAHIKVCPMQEIPCPNAGCEEVMKRRDMKWHLEECEFTEVPCKYRKLGCDVKLKRSAMPTHKENNDKIHLRMALEKADMQEEKEMTLNPWKSITFKLTDYQQKRRRNEVFTCPYFYTSPNGYHLALEVHANGSSGDGIKGTHLSMLIRIKQGRNDANLTWPLTGEANVTLLNQRMNLRHHFKTLGEGNDGILVDGAWECHDFIPHSKLGPYLINDSLYFRVSVCIPDAKPWQIDDNSSQATKKTVLPSLPSQLSTSQSCPSQ